MKNTLKTELNRSVVEKIENIGVRSPSINPQGRLADTDLIAFGQWMSASNGRAVDRGAVAAAEVLDPTSSIFLPQLGVDSAHGGIRAQVDIHAGLIIRPAYDHLGLRQRFHVPLALILVANLHKAKRLLLRKNIGKKAIHK